MRDWRAGSRGWSLPDAARLRGVPPISFARGAPTPECLDPALVSDCARAVLERDGRAVLSYGSGGGYGPLREWLAERHRVTAGQVFLTTGGLQGFVFYASLQLARRPGRVLVEGPTYDRPLKILAREGAEVVALPMDAEGLDPDALEAELARGGDVSFLYTIPTFQNPSGRTLGLPVLEDDPYGLVRYEGEAPPSIHELAAGSDVSFTSSFSKTVAPGLRVGYFVVPAELAAAFDERAVSTYISPSLLPQATVFELIDRGAFEPNLERVRGLLRVRRDAMLAALEDGFGERAAWSRPEGGYFLWLDLPAGTDAADLAERSAAAGVVFVKGADFFPGGAGGSSSARLAFSYETPERIAEGVAILASLA
jgi:2-aminoadipate transaminase